MECLKERSSYGEERMKECWDRLKDTVASDLTATVHHSECYKWITNKTGLARSKSRYEKSLETLSTPNRNDISEGACTLENTITPTIPVINTSDLFTF